jgi:hypothetical protein
LKAEGSPEDSVRVPRERAELVSAASGGRLLVQRVGRRTYVPRSLLKDALRAHWAGPLVEEARTLLRQELSTDVAAEALVRAGNPVDDLRQASREADAWLGLARASRSRVQERAWRETQKTLGLAYGKAYRRSLPVPLKSDFVSLLRRVKAEARTRGALAETMESARTAEGSPKETSVNIAWWWSEQLMLASAAIELFVESDVERRSDGSWTVQPVGVSGMMEYLGRRSWRPSTFSFDRAHLPDLGGIVRGVSSGFGGTRLPSGEEAACMTVASWLDGRPGAGPCDG